MNETYDTIELEKITIEIYQDSEPNESPREWSNLGCMLCWHNRYNLGDDNPFSEPDDFHKWLKDNPSIVLPLYLYDHSGITMSCSNSGYPFTDMFDSGQVGYIYVERAKILKEYGWKYLTTARIAKIKSHLMNEVEVYDDYLTGNVYGFITRCNECGAELDSCWGYYGTNWKENGLLEYAKGSECEDCKVTNKRLEQVTQLKFQLA